MLFMNRPAKSMRKILSLMCVILLTALVFNLGAMAANYPELTGFVTDTADMIDPGYEARINQLCGEIEKNSTVEIAVVTVESLEGLTRERYAVELFERAGIGKKDRDNGLLILIANEEREYRVEVGYGLEHIITDSRKVDIGDGILVPNFKTGEFGKGVYEAILAIEGLIGGHDEVLSEYKMKNSGSSGDSEGETPIAVFILIFIVFIIIRAVSTGRSGRRGRSGYLPIFLPGGGFSGRSGGFGSGGFGGFGGGMSGGGGFGGSW